MGSINDNVKNDKSNIFCRKNILYAVFVFLIFILIINDYIGFSNKEYLKNTNGGMSNKEKIEKKINDLIEEESKPINEKLINSCRKGMINGFLSGGMSGNISGCIINSASYGIINPMLEYVEYLQKKRQL